MGIIDTAPRIDCREPQEETSSQYTRRYPPVYPDSPQASRPVPGGPADNQYGNGGCVNFGGNAHKTFEGAATSSLRFQRIRKEFECYAPEVTSVEDYPPGPPRITTSVSRGSDFVLPNFNFQIIPPEEELVYLDFMLWEFMFCNFSYTRPRVVNLNFQISHLEEELGGLDSQGGDNGNPRLSSKTQDDRLLADDGLRLGMNVLRETHRTLVKHNEMLMKALESVGLDRWTLDGFHSGLLLDSMKAYEFPETMLRIKGEKFSLGDSPYGLVDRNVDQMMDCLNWSNMIKQEPRSLKLDDAMKWMVKTYVLNLFEPLNQAGDNLKAWMVDAGYHLVGSKLNVQRHKHLGSRKHVYLWECCVPSNVRRPDGWTSKMRCGDGNTVRRGVRDVRNATERPVEVMAY